jgi:hypothetical protein
MCENAHTDIRDLDREYITNKGYGFMGGSTFSPFPPTPLNYRYKPKHA